MVLLSVAHHLVNLCSVQNSICRSENKKSTWVAEHEYKNSSYKVSLCLLMSHKYIGILGLGMHLGVEHLYSTRKALDSVLSTEMNG